MELGIKLSFKDQVGHFLKVLDLNGISPNLRGGFSGIYPLIFYFSVLNTLLLSIFILYSYLFLAFCMVAHRSIPFFVFPSIAELLLLLFYTFT